MERHRTEQLNYVVTEQEHTLTIFESAKDFYAQGQFREAKELFTQVREISLTGKFEYLKINSNLYICIIDFERGGPHQLDNKSRIISVFLSRVRSLAGVIGAAKVHGLDGK